MLIKDLYQTVLMDPVLRQKANTLYIVSGYASANMVDRHLRGLAKVMKIPISETSVSVNLMIGMTAKEGISEPSHKAFNHLTAEVFSRNFTCGYYMGAQPTHAKAYAWYEGNRPIIGYVGSANYTYNGFMGNQQEVLSNEKPNDIFEYYQSLQQDSYLCSHEEVQGIIKPCSIIGETKESINASHEDGSINIKKVSSLPTRNRVDISLLDERKSDICYGLNWGDRGDRRITEAYIPVNAELGRSGFFPERGVHFTVHTDDGKTFLCARRQDGGKAIHSTQDNSIIGEYFRRRINASLDQPITKEHLESYGRTEVSFEKIDDDNYYMDFSKPTN